MADFKDVFQRGKQAAIDAEEKERQDLADEKARQAANGDAAERWLRDVAEMHAIDLSAALNEAGVETRYGISRRATVGGFEVGFAMVAGTNLPGHTEGRGLPLALTISPEGDLQTRTPYTGIKTPGKYKSFGADRVKELFDALAFEVGKAAARKR